MDNTKHLKKISIYNFQSHKETHVTFNKGANIFTGSSDVGKSAVIRAIRWVMENRPSGDAFRSNWGGETKVVLAFQDGTVIERIKGKNTNLYLMNGKEYKGFGTGVPEEIAEYLAFTDINMRNQHDSSFMLSLSPAKIVEKLNETVDLDLIDKASKISRKKKRDAETRKNNLDEELAKTKDEYNGFVNSIVSVEKYKKAAGELYDTYSECLKELWDIKDLFDDFESVKKEYGVYLKADEAAHSYLDRITKKLDEVKRLKTRMDELVDLSNKYDQIDKKAMEYPEEEQEKSVNKITKALEEMKSLTNKVKELNDLWNKHDEIDKKAMEYPKQEQEELVNKIDKYIEKIDERGSWLRDLEILVDKALEVEDKIKEIDEELEELGEEMGDIPECPFCGNRIEQN